MIVFAATVLSLLAAPAALATTQTAQSGNVTATFTFSGTYPNFTGLQLSIAQGGTVFYDEPVDSKLCGTYCAPGSPSGTGSHRCTSLDLEHDGQPDVVLDLYSGGAHCCSIEQIFSFDPGTMTYAKTQRDFGDPGEQIVDLGHNGRYEFLTADDSFAYEFTDFAASGLPIQILTFSDRRFINVTRHYPKLVARDAAGWLKAFKQHGQAALLRQRRRGGGVGRRRGAARARQAREHLPRQAAEGRAPEQCAQPRGARWRQVRRQAPEVPAHARLPAADRALTRRSTARRGCAQTPAAASASSGFG